MSFYGRANSSSIALSYLSYNYLRFNYGSGMDSTGSTFTAPASGAYWLLYTVLFDGSWVKANITIQGTTQTPTPAIVKKHMSYYGFDVMSRNQIISLTAGQQLKVYTVYSTYADSTCGSSFGAFMLDGLMSPLIMFDVYCSRNSGGQTPVFDVISYNYGNGWSNCSQAFIAPQAGIYYFGISAGVLQSPNSVTGDFQVSGAAVHYCLFDLDNNHNGLDLISRGCLLPLNASDVVSVHWRYSGIDTSYGETSLRGFLYSPIHGQQVAWSLHNYGYVAPAAVVTYGKVLFTKNCTYTAGGVVKVKVTGFYYMEVVAHVISNGGVMTLVTYDGGKMLNRLYFANSTVPFITRSVPFMAHLNTSSFVQTLNQGSALDGNNNGGISFHGFLLYPD